jgi:hypothetical protein
MSAPIVEHLVGMNWRGFRGALAVLVVGGFTACADTSEADDLPSAGDIYAAVFRQLDIPSGVDGEAAVVYVVERNDEPLSLDEQVQVIQDLEDDFDVRFVDDIEAAAEVDEDGSLVPPLDGALVAIGPPKPAEGDDELVVVRAEIMSSADVTNAWQFSLRGVDEVQIVEADETEPELLVTLATP